MIYYIKKKLSYFIDMITKNALKNSSLYINISFGGGHGWSQNIFRNSDFKFYYNYSGADSDVITSCPWEQGVCKLQYFCKARCEKYSILVECRKLFWQHEGHVGKICVRLVTEHAKNLPIFMNDFDRRFLFKINYIKSYISFIIF